jgi:hypothetical protein
MAIGQAVSFLRELLAGGPLPTNEVRARAEAAGFAWAMIRRAKDHLGIEAIRKSEGSAGAGRWLWSLPVSQSAKAEQQVAQGVQAAQTQVAQAAQPPPRPREIKVRRPGVVPQGPDEISWEQWQAVGCSVERLKDFLRQRGTL